MPREKGPVTNERVQKLEKQGFRDWELPGVLFCFRKECAISFPVESKVWDKSYWLVLWIQVTFPRCPLCSPLFLKASPTPATNFWDGRGFSWISWKILTTLKVLSPLPGTNSLV